MPDATLRTATDTYVREDKAGTAYSDARTLRLSNAAGARAYALIYFPVPFPAGATILDARLRLRRSGAWAGARTLTLRRLTAQLRASKATWSTLPTSTGPVAYADPGGADGTTIELDVKAAMTTVAGGVAFYGFRLETTDGTPVNLNAVEGLSAVRPELYVSWAIPPTKPTNLSPAGGRAVSGSKPVLRWAARAGTDDQTLAAIQVQVDPAGNFTTPAYDTGWLTTDAAELDLRNPPAPAPAYPGLNNGATAQWKVRTKDAAGLVSPWADAVSFARRDLAAATITSPVTAVTDTTPPALWTFGGTQTAYRIKLRDPANPSKDLADSGKIDGTSGTATSWTVPAGLLTGPGPYELELWVWDQYDREATPLDPGYAVVKKSFTVTTDPSVATVLGLTATQNSPYPTVLLHWTRGSAPDSYTVKRDGVVLEDLIPPGDVLSAGTSYVYEDESAQTWHAHSWSVHAVVNGKMADSSVVTFTPTQRGIWLLDKGRDLRVWIAGRDQGTWVMGEDATVFYPLGGTKAVRRVQAQRGFEGSLTGPLLDGYGRLSWDYEADLLAMREEPDRPVILAAADLTIKVLLGNVTTIPTTSVPPQRIASFDFWEVG